MKARVKESGEIVDVIAISDYINESGQIIGEYKDANGMLYNSYDLDFYIEEGITIPDYWTRLEYQYAGMAMQTMLATLYNPKYHKELMACYTEVDAEEVARLSKYYAHTLVEKMKEVK